MVDVNVIMLKKKREKKKRDMFTRSNTLKDVKKNVEIANAAISFSQHGF